MENQNFKFNIGDTVCALLREFSKVRDGSKIRTWSFSPWRKITDRTIAADNREWYKFGDKGWTTSWNFFTREDLDKARDKAKSWYDAIETEFGVVDLIFSDEPWSAKDNKEDKSKEAEYSPRTIKIAGNKITINGHKFKLIQEGKVIETVDVDKYKYFKDNIDELAEKEPDADDAFDLDYTDYAQDALAYKPYKAAEYFDNFMKVAEESDDDYGTRFDVYTDYWFISLRKIADMSDEDLNSLVEDTWEDRLAVILDSENNPWFIEVGQD